MNTEQQNKAGRTLTECVFKGPMPVGFAEYMLACSTFNQGNREK